MRQFIYYLIVAVSAIIVVGCGADTTPTTTPIAQIQTQTPSPTFTSSPTSTATATPTNTPTSTPTATPSPTVTPTPTNTPTPTITPTPTRHPMTDYTIEGLRQREFPGGTIETRSVLTATDVFTRYYISYPSDDLTITGIMQIPTGEGPFPVVILNHGWIAPARYWSGSDTWKAAEYLNARGYLTLSSDFRGWGQSDKGDNFFRTGILIDALNLIGSLPSVPEANPEQVGIWGHSMGGGLATKAITIDPRIRAAVLYAPVSGYDVEIFSRWGIPIRFDTESSLQAAYIDALSRLDFLQRTSPNYYFDSVTAPVQIHSGTADSSTPPRWSADIHAAMQAAGKEVEYFEYSRQGHAFQGESWELFMGRVADFFDRQLSDSPPSP